MFLSHLDNTTLPITDTKHIIPLASSVKLEDSLRLNRDISNAQS